MHVFVYVGMCEFRGRNSVKRGRMLNPGKVSIFLNKGKMVIYVGNWKFPRSRITKWTSPLNLSREI